MEISKPLGLTTQEAEKRQKVSGYNELQSSKEKTIFRIALEVLKEPMFILLIACGTLYIILGDYREGLILGSAIFVIIGITFYQSRKTERALEELKKLSSPRATVLRDGEMKKIPGREVVPDDILILNEGDRISADATILEVNNLLVNEAILTGESMPVRKISFTGNELENKPGGDDLPFIFSGTLIIQGSATAKVTANGINSQFGKIGESLKSLKEEETKLQGEMKILIRRLAIIGIVLSVLVVVAFYFTRGNLAKAFLTGLSSAMSILPEEFPVVLTIFLALGAWRMSRKNVLTRKPAAIETLGSATVLCADKTGTITQNKMDVEAFYNGKQTLQGELNENNYLDFQELTRISIMASQFEPVDPMEKAIRINHEKFDKTNIAEEYVLLREYALSKELLSMTRVLKKKSDSTLTAAAKGAPEIIFKLCNMTTEEVEQHTLVVNKYADAGLRMLGVAVKKLESEILPESQLDFNFSFVGLIGLADPIRPEVPEAIEECYSAGIRVIMITGDFPLTAKSIGNQIGLRKEGRMITGNELEKMSDDELQKEILDTIIFARVVPAQKLRIVKALQANGDVVAMTGDGVNDAPALKAANIGIAMGGKGTDVAREASSLVLLDDNFASIVVAIRLGRRIFDNLQKAMSFILAVHVPIVGLALLPAFMPSLPILLLPIHIVFLELIIDPSCTIAFETESEEAGIMKKMPRKQNEKFFGRDKILRSLFKGILTFSAVIIVYYATINEGHSDNEIRAITFVSLILANVGLILTNLSRTRNFLHTLMAHNRAANIILGGTVLVLFLVIEIPWLQEIFQFENPGLRHFIPSVIGGLGTLAIFEIVKYFRYSKSRSIG